MTPTVAAVLQYGALGLLLLVLLGIGWFARAVMVPLLRDVLETNAALRVSMASMGERLTELGSDLHRLADEMTGMRRDFVRAGIERSTPEPPPQRPRTDPTGRHRRG